MNNNDTNSSINEDYVDKKSIPNDDNPCSNVTNYSVDGVNIDKAKPTAGVADTKYEYELNSGKSESNPTFRYDDIEEGTHQNDHKDTASINDDYVNSKEIPNDQNACANVTNDSSDPVNLDKLKPSK